MRPASWSLGVYIGLPITILLVVVGVGMVVASWVIFTRDDDGLRGGGTVVGVLLTLITLGVAGVGFWPWNPSFHRWYHVTGVVSQIGSRQISADRGMSTRYIFVIDGGQYGVDDTRAAVTKVGDRVSLLCKKEWVYQSVSGWACNWDS